MNKNRKGKKNKKKWRSFFPFFSPVAVGLDDLSLLDDEPPLLVPLRLLVRRHVLPPEHRRAPGARDVRDGVQAGDEQALLARAELDVDAVFFCFFFSFFCCCFYFFKSFFFSLSRKNKWQENKKKLRTRC